MKRPTLNPVGVLALANDRDISWILTRDKWLSYGSPLRGCNRLRTNTVAVERGVGLGLGQDEI